MDIIFEQKLHHQEMRRGKILWRGLTFFHDFKEWSWTSNLKSLHLSYVQLLIKSSYGADG